MGVNNIIFCSDCMVSAPNIGDCGLIGLPSLTAKRNDEWAELFPSYNQSFGYIYKGLKPMKILTKEIEAFHSFLSHHANHKIYLFNPVMTIDEIPSELYSDKFANKKLTDFNFYDNDFIEAFYEIYCDDCNEAYRSKLKHPFRPFDQFSVDSLIIEQFRTHVLKVDRENFDRTFDIIDGYKDGGLNLIEIFLEKHEHHEVYVRLIT